MKNFILAFLAITLTVSCSQIEQDDASKNQIEHIQSAQLTTVTTSTCPNLNNPYDIYGQSHNNALSQFYNSTFATGSTSNTDFKDAFEQIGFYGFQGNKALEDVTNETITKEDFITQNTSGEVSEKLLDILSIINTSNSLAEMQNALENFNLNLQSNSTLTADDKHLLFAGSSIASHSACYWLSAEGLSWPSSTTKAAIPDPVKDIIGADFVGGVGRIIAFGLLGGPIGWGAVGAWTAGVSAATALWKGIDFVLSEFTDWW